MSIDRLLAKLFLRPIATLPPPPSRSDDRTQSPAAVLAKWEYLQPRPKIFGGSAARNVKIGMCDGIRLRERPLPAGVSAILRESSPQGGLAGRGGRIRTS